jgi:hypothetical protein
MISSPAKLSDSGSPKRVSRRNTRKAREHIEPIIEEQDYE